MGRERPLVIAGTGTAVPEAILTAGELDTRLGLAPGESFRITGVAQRHLSNHETASGLGAAALRRALEDAQVAWEEIDCLVCASATMDQALPFNAAMLLAEIPEARSHRVSALDIGASCLSFLHALDLVSCAIEAGRYETVAIVSADIATFTIDLGNLRENGIFGDGAAAVIVRKARPGESSRILAASSATLPEGVDFCRIRSGGSRYHRRGDGSHSEALFEMEGRRLFALAARALPEFVARLLADAGLKNEEIRHFIPHQASRQGLDHISRLLGLDDGRMVDIFGGFGNQVAASLPTALHFAIHRHGLSRGDKVLLLGTGAGVSLGGIVLEY